jgi:hypothetical protein
VYVHTVRGGEKAVKAAEQQAKAKGTPPVYPLSEVDEQLSRIVSVQAPQPYPYGGLVPGTYYVFRVSCINALGEGPTLQSNAAAPVRRNARVLELLAALDTNRCAGTDGDRNGDGEDTSASGVSMERRAVRFADDA